MAKAAEPKAPDFDALPALSELSIARTRAFWRHLAWQLLPETFVGTDAGKDEVDLPSPSNASLLAMLRALHGTRVNEDAKAQRDAAQGHLRELLETAQSEGPASRLDLAADLFGVDGQARLALELVAVSEVDTLTAHSARVLSSRLQRDGGHDINLLDDCFAVAGLGAGTIRRLCGPRGTLRNIGAVIERDDSGVGLSATVLDFLDGRLDAPSPLDEHAVRLRLPSEGLQTLGRQRSTWTAVLERAVGLGRPVLLSGMPGFGGPAMVALMAANRGLAWRGVHAQPLVDDETGHVSDLMPVLHAEARLHGVVQVIHHLERLEKTFRENLDCLRRFVDALIRIERPIVLVHEGPVAAEIGVHLAIEAGLIHIEVQPMPVEERGELLRV